MPLFDGYRTDDVLKITGFKVGPGNGKRKHWRHHLSYRGL
jgi:hypothetical protein